MLILLLNDDGYQSVLTTKVREYLECFGHSVYSFLPDTDNSGASSSISTGKKIYYKKIREKEFVVCGTPCDCMMVGVQYLKTLNKNIDLVVSGLNLGSNLGLALRYSGTVNAAQESLEYNIPSIAISKIRELNYSVEDRLYILENVIEYMHKHGRHKGKCFGVNINFVNGEKFQCALEKQYVHYENPLYYMQVEEDFAILKFRRQSMFKKQPVRDMVLLEGICSENVALSRNVINRRIRKLKRIINARIKE